MKQHITKEQLEELSESGKDRLREWWVPLRGDWVAEGSKEFVLTALEDEGYYVIEDESFRHAIEKKDMLPLLSIGQMIQFLNREYVEFYMLDEDNFPDNYEELQGKPPCIDCWYVRVVGKGEHSHIEKELADALWEACRVVLETESVT